MDEATFHAYLGYALLASMVGAFLILAAGTAAPYGRRDRGADAEGVDARRGRP